MDGREFLAMNRIGFLARQIQVGMGLLGDHH